MLSAGNYNPKPSVSSIKSTTYSLYQPLCVSTAQHVDNNRTGRALSRARLLSSKRFEYPFLPQLCLRLLNKQVNTALHTFNVWTCVHCNLKMMPRLSKILHTTIFREEQSTTVLHVENQENHRNYTLSWMIIKPICTVTKSFTSLTHLPSIIGYH